MRYGEGPEVLSHVDLTLERGEFVFVMGPSGAGKTSLLRLLALLRRPAAGRLTMFGDDVARLEEDRLRAHRRRIGMVFQDVRLLDHLSVFDNAALPLRINGRGDEQIARLVSEVLTWFGLGEVAEASPTTLSMGQRQLVSVARAVVTRPDLLLCDEPTANLDGKHARRLMHLFTELCKLGTTVVLATHSADLVERHPHPIVQVAGGRVTGPTPASPSTLAAAE
ncbi:MAG: cell division ATP-binding protein FtsE [Geminicoccaceae bacterium]